MMDQPTAPPTESQDLSEFLGEEPLSPRSRNLRRAGIAIVVLLVLWALWSWLGSDETEVRYATRPVERGALTVMVSATGNLQPTNQVDVGSELSGLVTTVLVDNNDKVTKGQEIARLDTSRLQDAINQSRAALQSAQANVGQAQATAAQSSANLSRLQEVYRLSGGKVPSATELDSGRADARRAVAAVRAAEAAVAQARAQLSSDQTQFGKATIRSPVDGVILSRQIEPGQTVAASLNAPVLFVIAEDLSRMRLEAKVDEADVGQVKSGQRATFTVDAFPGRTFPARIERVDVGANASGSTSSSSSSSSTATNTVVSYMARLTLANPELLLRPGMTATADIVTMEKQNVLLAPNAALRFSPERAARAGQSSAGSVTSMLMPMPRRGNRGDRSATIGRGSQQTVYVLGEDGKPKPVKVTVGDSDGSQTEISGDGVRAGMKVITGQLATGDQSAGGKSSGGGQSGGGQGGGGQGGKGGGQQSGK